MVNRKPYQGIWNIIRFNWHFYALALSVVLVLFVFSYFVSESYHSLLIWGGAIILLPILVSLFVSYYVYDLSQLYSLEWLELYAQKKLSLVVNVNAGFDETSNLINSKLSPVSFKAFDFYNPAIHTEVSIRRARESGLVYPETQEISTSEIPLVDDSADLIILFLSAHEIRNTKERMVFFSLLKQKCKGEIIVVEHVRDINNFLAYNIGFYHFHSLRTWQTTFDKAGLKVLKSYKLNSFIRIFVLK